MSNPTHERNRRKLFAAWLERSEEERQAVEAEFWEIFEMSCEKGVAAILDEARWQWRDDPDGLRAFVEEFSALPGHSHRAMATYLDHPECWTGATRFYHADALPHWRKRKHLGHRPAAVDVASLEHLADLIPPFATRFCPSSSPVNWDCLVRHEASSSLIDPIFWKIMDYE